VDDGVDDGVDPTAERISIAWVLAEQESVLAEKVLAGIDIVVVVSKTKER
jgi:hypothetical protein